MLPPHNTDSELTEAEYQELLRGSADRLVDRHRALTDGVWAVVQELKKANGIAAKLAASVLLGLLRRNAADGFDMSKVGGDAA